MEVQLLVIVRLRVWCGNVLLRQKGGPGTSKPWCREDHLWEFRNRELREGWLGRVTVRQELISWRHPRVQFLLLDVGAPQSRGGGHCGQRGLLQPVDGHGGFELRSSQPRASPVIWSLLLKPVSHAGWRARSWVTKGWKPKSPGSLIPTQMKRKEISFV